MAYVNATINQGGFGSFQVDAAGALSLYQRVKFSTTASSNSGKPTLVVANGTDRAIGVVMTPAAAGFHTTIRFLNSQGEQFGIASGTIGLGVLVYAGAAGVLAATGTLVVGISTTAGFDGGAFTYIVLTPAA